MRNILIGIFLSSQAIASGTFNKYSIAQEKESGRRTSELMGSQIQIVHDPRIDAYTADILAKLAGHLPSPFDYSVVVFSGPIRAGSPVYPLVMPPDYMRTDIQEPLSVAGGTIFIPLALLADAPRDEWFVFQIAHAMAHIASRHAARLESRMEVLLPALEPDRSLPDPGVAARMAFLSFSRKFELDADAAAMSSLFEGGYDAKRVLPLGYTSQQGHERPFTALHVKKERREGNLETILNQFPPRDPIHLGTGFLEAKTAAAGRMNQ